MRILSAFQYFLVIGFGLIGSGFVEWTAETLFNEVVNDAITAISGNPSHTEFVNTWNVIQWQFVAGIVIVAVGILLRRYDVI